MENKIVVAVKGIIFHENKVLIIKRASNDEVDPGSWEFAGGKIEFGEELEEALIRETKEEAGICIVVEKLLYAAQFKSDPTRQVIIITYKCHARDIDVVLSEEHTDYKWVEEAELKQLLSPGILNDLEKYNVKLW